MHLRSNIQKDVKLTTFANQTHQAYENITKTYKKKHIKLLLTRCTWVLIRFFSITKQTQSELPQHYMFQTHIPGCSRQQCFEKYSKKEKFYCLFQIIYMLYFNFTHNLEVLKGNLVLIWENKSVSHFLIRQNIFIPFIFLRQYICIKTQSFYL